MTMAEKKLLDGSYETMEAFLKDLDTASEEIQQALTEILAPNSDEKEENAKILKEHGINPGDLAKKMRLALERVMQNDMLFKDALNLSEENMEAFYTLAYQMYKQGEIATARKLFQLLIFIDPSQPKYHYAQGVLYHKAHDYMDAAKCFLTAGTIGKEPYPLAFFHASDCYIQLNDLPSAIITLAHCIENCGEDAQHTTLKKKCEVLKEALTKKFKSAA